MQDVQVQGAMYVQRVRVSLVRDGRVALESKRMASASDIAALVRPLIADRDREVFVLICLDQKNQPTAVHQVSEGSLSASLVHPREVFTAAILAKAAAIVVAHNHPSGDPTPSREDREITLRLKAGGELLGIPLLDHVVIGADGAYRSFSEAGLL